MLAISEKKEEGRYGSVHQSEDHDKEWYLSGFFFSPTAAAADESWYTFHPLRPCVCFTARMLYA
jgi:hypothetical protein